MDKLTGVVIAHNTGLGDHIVMNGAVRHFLFDFDIVYIFALMNHKLANVGHMFRDTDRIKVIPVGKPRGKRAFDRALKWRYNYEVNCGPDSHPISKDVDFKGGFRKTVVAGKDWGRMGDTTWPRYFYQIQGVPYKCRHEDFYFERDRAREDALFEKLKLPDRYAFVCNWSTQAAVSLDQIRKRTSLPIVLPYHEDTLIFDWMGVIENATEIHTVDTSYFHLVKQMRLDVPKFYYPVRNVAKSGHDYLNDAYDDKWERVKL